MLRHSACTLLNVILVRERPIELFFLKGFFFFNSMCAHTHCNIFSSKLKLIFSKICMSLTTEARLHSTCQTCQSHLKTDFQHMCTNACEHLPSPLPTHLHRAKKGKEGREEKYFGKVLGPFLLLSKSASSGRFEN